MVRFWVLRRQWHPTPVLLPGKSHGWRGLVVCSPGGCEESDTTEWLHFNFSLSCTGEGNGNPLQCSCLKNPRDGGAWWAAVYGVAQSQTRLKWLSSSSSSNPACGFQLWFYFHLFMWVVNRGLLLRLLWRTWPAPVRAGCEGGTVAWFAGPWQHRVLRGVGLGQQEIWCSARAWQPIPTFFPGESSGQTTLAGTVHRIIKSWIQLKWPCMHRPGTFFSLWQFCPSGDHAWRWQCCLDHGDPGNASYIGLPVTIVTGDVVLLRIFLACHSSAPVRIEHESGSTA